MREKKVQKISNRLEGKVAVITGVGAGIGQGCALLLAQHGAKVFGCDINHEAAKATAEIAEKNGFPLYKISATDLTKESEVNSLIDSACSVTGGIDILVNAAAFCVMKWIEEMTLDDWQTTLRGELDIVFMACKAAWPKMKKNGGGSIINFSSANSHMALKGSPALAHCAGKGGVLAMTQQLAMEGAPHGIRANSIAPGLVKSASTAGVLNNPKVRSALEQVHMIQRLGEPEDIAWAALYLASEESSWVTASEIRVDGGATRW